jgi:hypothetical protein
MRRVDTLCDYCRDEIEDGSLSRISATFNWEGSMTHTYHSPERDFCDAVCLSNYVFNALPLVIGEQRGMPPTAVRAIKR